MAQAHSGAYAPGARWHGWTVPAAGDGEPPGATPAEPGVREPHLSLVQAASPRLGPGQCSACASLSRRLRRHHWSLTCRRRRRRRGCPLGCPTRPRCHRRRRRWRACSAQARVAARPRTPRPAGQQAGVQATSDGWLHPPAAQHASARAGLAGGLATLGCRRDARMSASLMRSTIAPRLTELNSPARARARRRGRLRGRRWRAAAERRPSPARTSAKHQAGAQAFDRHLHAAIQRRNTHIQQRSVRAAARCCRCSMRLIWASPYLHAVPAPQPHVAEAAAAEEAHELHVLGGDQLHPVDQRAQVHAAPAGRLRPGRAGTQATVRRKPLQAVITARPSCWGHSPGRATELWLHESETGRVGPVTPLPAAPAGPRLAALQLDSRWSGPSMGGSNSDGLGSVHARAGRRRRQLNPPRLRSLMWLSVASCSDPTCPPLAVWPSEPARLTS